MNQDVRTTRSLRCLRPILGSWIDLNLKYAKDQRWLDCPWWYKERAAVSLVAAAVWQAGGHALEEYTTSKRSYEGPYRGRGDLYFKIGSRRFIAEAKFRYIHLGRRSKNAKQSFKKLLREAKKSVKDNDATTGHTRLGFLFLSPRIPKDWSRQEIQDTIEYSKALADSTKPDAHARVFPDQGLKLQFNKSVFPGTILLVRA